MSHTSGKYFTFWLDGQLFAVPVLNMLQILGMLPLTELPGMPYYLKGLIKLRGEIIPIADMRLRLAKSEADYTEETAILILSINETLFGVIVDAVHEVAVIPDEEFTDIGNLQNEFSQRFICGISEHDGKTILHIDINKLF